MGVAIPAPVAPESLTYDVTHLSQHLLSERRHGCCISYMFCGVVVSLCIGLINGTHG